MAKTTEHRKQGPSRRTILKGAAAIAGVAAGTKALGGFPPAIAMRTSRGLSRRPRHMKPRPSCAQRVSRGP